MKNKKEYILKNNELYFFNQNNKKKSILLNDNLLLGILSNFDFDNSYISIIDNHYKYYNLFNSLNLKENDAFIIKPNLELIRLYPTNFCNAFCSMCDIGKASNFGIDRLRKSSENEMSIETLTNLLNSKIFKNKKFKFSLGMVEPLLHKNIGNYIETISKKGHSVALITNGILLKQKAKEISKSGLDYIMVSIDGTEKIHDQIRGYKGIYRKAIEGIKTIKGLSPDLRIIINCAISNINYHNLYDFVLELEKEKIYLELQLQFLYFVSENMAKNHNKIIDLNQSVSVISDDINVYNINPIILENQIKKIKNLNTNYINQIRIRPDYSNKKDIENYFDEKGDILKDKNKCFFPFNQVSIKTDGDVLFHSRCFDYIIGNILHNDIEEIFLGEKANIFREKLKEFNYIFPACTRCCGIMAGW